MNPNNCNTCDYKRLNNTPGAHCYMFRTAPTERCMQHSLSQIKLTDMQQALRLQMGFK